MPARRLLPAIAGLSCLAVAGCGAGTTALASAPGRPASGGRSRPAAPAASVPSTMIPTQLGNTWVYAMTSSVLGKGTDTERISSVTRAAGGQRATLASSLRLDRSKTPLTFSSDYTAEADGSVTFGSASSMGTKLMSSANLNWPSPAALTPGHPRTSTITGSFLGFQTRERLTVTEVGPATVTVPAGTYQATLVEQTAVDPSGSREVVESWVVNGIGQVKTVTTVKVKGAPPALSSVQATLELVSFSKG